MPIGYLFPVTLLALATLLALTAPDRRPVLAMLSFRAGVVVNELPFVAACLLLASTALAFAQGDIATPAGRVGVAVAALTLGGLAVLVRRGLRARGVLAAAMHTGLGDGWRATITPAFAARLRTRRSWARILLLPLGWHARGVRRVANLPYGPAGRRNLLDVYHQRTRPSGVPVLIHLHGGGYRSGRKNRQSLPLINRLASQGWVCISANYRLRPAAGFLDHLSDAKRVIAWAHAHAREYGGDPAATIVAGSSAGAHLTTLSALTQHDPRFQPGFEDADTTVRAAVCLNGWFGEYYEGAVVPTTPLAYLRPGAPPLLVVHGDHDTVVPVAAARRFAAAYRRASGRPVVCAELPGAQHAFDLFASPRFCAVVDAVEAFAAWVRSRGHEPDADRSPGVRADDGDQSIEA